MTMAVPRHVDRRTFLAYLRQSGLLKREQLAAAAPRLPESSRGRVLARALVEQGLLTRFQAEQLLAGRTGGFFLDQYRILEQIGQGGMGRVFKAEHRTMGRTVALKVLAPRLLKTPRAQVLFLREVRAIAQAVHPNIVTAFDANQVNGRYYLVLEYINGPNLDQLVRDTGPLPVGQACDFVRQVADGLQHAFRLGMVHRDIKPANLLLQRGSGDERGTYGQVKISDFGLARLGEAGNDVLEEPDTLQTRQNTVMGTPDYIAPEQARDLHRTDIRSDLYSLGCTFYFLLTGQVPFPGGSILEKLVRHGTEEPPPLEQLRPDVPAAVAAIVRRLMAKKPEDRFQTPAELAAALAPFAVSSPAAWSEPRPAEPFADLQPTPVAEEAGDSDPLADLDDSAALIGTLAADGSPTPLSAAGMASSTRLSRAEKARQKRRLRLALLCAVGIVGALLAAGVALIFVLAFG
jgi:serine/threonine protein kinase